MECYSIYVILHCTLSMVSNTTNNQPVNFRYPEFVQCDLNLLMKVNISWSLWTSECIYHIITCYGIVMNVLIFHCIQYHWQSLSYLAHLTPTDDLPEPFHLMMIYPGLLYRQVERFAWFVLGKTFQNKRIVSSNDVYDYNNMWPTLEWFQTEGETASSQWFVWCTWWQHLAYRCGYLQPAHQQVNKIPIICFNFNYF